MRKIIKLVLPVVIILASSSNVLAIDIEAGPIWNNDDAGKKCPVVCSGLEWNGNWKTTVPGKMSVCGCDQPASGGYFKLTTQFRESHGECLEGNQVNGSMNGAAFMDKCQNVTGQLWKATPAENGYFKLTTQFREGENECLEGNQVNGSMNGAAFMDKCQDVSGQLWKVTSAGNGYVKLTTQFREGENECLEGNQVNGSMNGAAFMDKCQDVSGQLWKFKYSESVRVVEESIPTACSDAVQGKIAWDYKGSTTWASANVERLCKDAESSLEPARCFQRVMHDGVNWGGGTQWNWENALNLCESTRDANVTIQCFESAISKGDTWQTAIDSCSK